MASKKPISETSENDDVFKEKEQMPPKGKLDMSLEFMRPFRRESNFASNMELVVMITKETQTDWEWAEVQAKLLQPIEVQEAPKKTEIDPSKPITPPPVVTPLNHIRTEADDVVPEPYLELKMSRSETRVMDTPVSEKRKHGGATPVQEPWPPRSPLYGRPVMFFDDDEDLIESPKKEGTDSHHSDKDSESLLDGMTAADKKLPRLGLPGSLRVKKDSQEPERIRNREQFQQMISEPALRPAGDDESVASGDPSFTNLVCEFCENPLRPFPTLEQQRTMASSELYCCDDYRKFVEYVLATDDSFEQQLKAKLAGAASSDAASDIDKAKSDKLSDQSKLKAAKQAQRTGRQQTGDDEKRHRLELERHMAMLEKAKKMRETQMKDSKNVKTINFQLSKYRCYEEGMVILPPDFHLSEMEQFQHRKIQLALAEQAAMYQRRQIVDIEGLSSRIDYISTGAGDVSSRHHGEQSYLLDGGVPVIKKYEDKQTTFLILLADGTSTVYYPSGNIAITVSAFNGIRTFTAFDDLPTSDTRIMAMFMSSGFGTVYTGDGTIRLSLTPATGFEVNPGDGTKRRRWTWAEMAAGSHIHAPPFQCIFYHLNSYLSVRIGDYQDWTLHFFYKQYRCRFNVMAFNPFEIVDSSAFDLSDIRLVRLNKYKAQFSESHSKLKALLREINYMLGLMPNAAKSIDGPPTRPDQTPRVGAKKKTQPGSGNKTARQSNSNFLPPLVNQPAIQVD